MRTDELNKVDGELFSQYVAKFGMFDTFSAPDITAIRLESLMTSALESGKPIEYAKHGWEIPGTDFVV